MTTPPMLAPLEKLSARRRADVYWFLALLGLLPALRDDLLFPHSWITPLLASYSLPPIENPFALMALPLALVVGVLALGSPQRIRLLAMLPFVTIAVADFGITLEAGLSTQLDGLYSVYVGSAFVVFVYFVIAGTVISAPFFAFLFLLVSLQLLEGSMTWPQITVFVVATLAARLAVEAWRQNRPLLRQLGWANFRVLARRTLALWWPMLFLIALGLWLSARLMSGTEELLYEKDVVTPYCAADLEDLQAELACPGGELVLKKTDVHFLPLVRSDVIVDPPECEVWDQRGLEIRTEPPPKPFACPPRDSLTSEWPLTRLPLFESLDRMTARRAEVSKWRLDQAMVAINVATLRAAGEFEEEADAEARRLFSVVPKTTGMKTSTCYFPDITCAAANVVIDGLNAAYASGRRKTEREFVDKMKEHAREGSEVTTQLVDSTTELAQKELQHHIDVAAARTRQAIDRVRMAANLTGQLLFLLLVVAVIKSLLYVFARVAFDKSTDIDVDMLDPEDVVAEGTVTHLQEVTIPGSYPYKIFYKANYQPLGFAPRLAIPQWRASLLSRLRFGAWNMNCADLPLEDEHGITFNSIEAEHLVDWEMQEGEEVVFSYRNFVAMNENVQLRTVISLRVATLLLGRIVFHTARCNGGPGRLILRTRGKPATAEQVGRSIPAARLVAWNRYARFSVDSHLTKADIFLNGFNLQRSRRSTGDAEGSEGPQGILVVEADARDGGLLVGTLRFARNFLLPV